MKVSIITVSYNSEDTIRGTIESVLSQDYSDIEYIIVDGASSDGTIAIVNEYRDRITHIVSEPDSGMYDAMNKGISIASGEIIGILNSDDFFETAMSVSAVVGASKDKPEAEVLFGDVVFVNPDDLKRVIRFYSASHFKPWKLKFGWMPPHPATFIRASAYQKAGNYSLDYKISADYEMFVRLLLVHRLSYARIDKVLVRMRAGGVSTAGIASSYRLNSEIVQACKRNGIYTNIFMVLSKIPFKLFELFKRPGTSSK